MMYLSMLMINVGTDPDRPRPGRLWLRNLYRVHQRLCMAFPCEARKSDDPSFLKPFKPEDFGSSEPKQVHVARRTGAGFLFRVDRCLAGRVMVVVQSAVEPDWGYAFHNAGHLLAAPWEVKPFEPSFADGQRLRFRLVANPTKRLRKDSLEKNGRPVEARWVGKRVPVRVDEFDGWLERRAHAAGFSVDRDSTTAEPGYVYVNRARSGKGQRLRSARFDGVLKITDLARFQETVVCGIGPAKGYGFGLLSLARPAP